MSSEVRSGKSASICASDRPDARYSSTSYTVMRRPRIAWVEWIGLFNVRMRPHGFAIRSSPVAGGPRRYPDHLQYPLTSCPPDAKFTRAHNRLRVAARRASMARRGGTLGYGWGDEQAHDPRQSPGRRPPP